MRKNAKARRGFLLGAGILLTIIGFILLIIAVVVFVMTEGDGGCLIFGTGAIGLIMIIVGVILLVVNFSAADTAALPSTAQYLSAMRLIR